MDRIWSGPLVNRRVFLGEMTRNSMIALVGLTIALFSGMAGYHWLEGLSWLDAFENAAMILGGMGPVVILQTTAGKVFAGCYALFAGTTFLVVVGVAFAPLVQRALHRFHLDLLAALPESKP
jgi:hypothetical protein